MTHRRLVTTAIAAVCLFLPTLSRAEVPAARLQRLRQQAARTRERLERIPQIHRERLSAATQNYMQTSRRWSDIETRLQTFRVPGSLGGRRPTAARTRMGGQAPALTASLTGGKVSDPSADAAISFLSSFTQSETSAAWCGNNVLVNYNDSGSLLPSALAGGGISFSGYSRSTDKGATFTDLGYLPPSSNPNFQLLGDPVAACTDASTFYQANLLIDFGPFTSIVALSKSTDGGLTFGDPVKAVEKSIFGGHFLDKEWMTVDPTDANNVYVTYTDFDSSGSICGTSSGFPIFRIGIELAKSTDGGTTWGAPIDVETACDPDGNQGSQVVVDGSGKVYVAWEHFPGALPTNELRLRKSTDGGATFGATVLVSSTVPVGGNRGRHFLQDVVRVSEFPSLAVDRSGGHRDGSLYVSWNDGRFASVPDVATLDGLYNFSDVLFVRSTDGGATFNAPTKVNRTSDGLFTEQYMPAVGVDKTGEVGVCFYDRRRDGANFLTDRTCARSRDGGTSWTNGRIGQARFGFACTEFQDFLIAYGYQGDYDTLTGDFLNGFSGLIGGFADNALGSEDVKSNTLP